MTAQATLFDVEQVAPYDAAVLSPLRYPGGKLWLADYVDQMLTLNHLRPAAFVEPFAGGASIALTLLARNRVSQIGLIDRDPMVAAFWATVFRDTEWLVKQIATVEVSLDQWRRFRSGPIRGRRQMALACLFFNRTNYSGILTRQAGPIGGQKQESQYKIDCRFPRETLIARVERIAQLRDRVAFIWNCSWRQGLARLTHLCRQGRFGASETNIFYYFDPPFFEKADRLYNHYFNDRDHWALRATLVRLRAPWILSYDASHKVQALYGRACVERKLQVQYIHVEYTAARSGKARSTKREAIIAPHEAMLPQHTSVQHFAAKTVKFLQEKMVLQAVLPTVELPSPCRPFNIQGVNMQDTRVTH